MTLAIAVSGRGLVDPDEPVVHVDDEAFMRGRGAFETLRVYGGRPFRLGEHLDRLAVSCARLGFSAPARDEIEALAVLVVGSAADAMLRIYATPGRGDGPQAIASLSELPPDLDDLRARGIEMISVAFRPADLIGGIKFDELRPEHGRRHAARAAGADDAVFLGDGGVVLEATTSNIWWRAGDRLFTPAVELGILAGVTRSVALEAAGTLGYPVEEGELPVSALAAADEAFTTSSVREVMSVVSLDGAPIGAGLPGPAAAAFQAALRGSRVSDLRVRFLSAVHRGIYRLSGGRLGRRIAGMPVLLLTTVGRRSGRPRTVPLAYIEDGDAIVLVASYGGRPHNPAWFENLIAAGEGEVTIGRERRLLRARRATPDERARLWPKVVATYDGYARYQAKTSREIPLAILECSA